MIGILYRAVMPRGACIGFPRLYEGDESNAPGDHLPTFYATFYDTESIMDWLPPEVMERKRQLDTHVQSSVELPSQAFRPRPDARRTEDDPRAK